jgi:superfamily II DNA or RNA helicase
MSRVVSIHSLRDAERVKIEKDLTIEVEQSKYAKSQACKIVRVLAVDGDHVYLPFAYSLAYPRPSIKEKRSVLFTGTLREEQKVVRDEAITALNDTGSVLISLYTGGGKTVTAINICSKIKARALIVIHRIVLLNQWAESITKFCPGARVEIISTSTDILPDADFYIMNCANVTKKPRAFYSPIRTLVVDEAHLIMAEGLSECMLHLAPRFVIGLSATPHRYDGLDVLFDLYFGRKRIVRKLWHPHIVWEVRSGFTPKVEFTTTGKVNWSALLEEQANNVERNELILSIVKRFPRRTFLILTKRVSQARHLVSRLTEMGESVTSLIGTEQEFDRECRVLVGTNSKAGVGFDHDKLDSLILGADLEQYFIQYLGRVFRRKDVQPMIFDIVDENPTLLKHFKTRRGVYIEHGGVIKTYVK